MEVNSGDRIAIVGPNGSGKTKLFKELTGIELTAWLEKQQLTVHEGPFEWAQSKKGEKQMNRIEAYWQHFCHLEGLKNIRYKEAFQFGEKADWLAGLVVDGIKKATCSSFPLYELEGESLPEIGDYQIVLNSQDEPVAIIESYSIEIYPFNKVPVDFALAEGEGTYEEWKEAHVAFFSRELSGKGLEFSEEMLTVCDHFKKVFPK